MKFDIESMTLEFKTYEQGKNPHGDEVDYFPTMCVNAYEISQVINLEGNQGDKQKSLGMNSALIVNHNRCYWLKEKYEEILYVYKYVKKDYASYNNAIKNMNIKLLDKNVEIASLMESVVEKIGAKK